MKRAKFAGTIMILVFMCMSAVLAQNCNWAGTWNTGWTGQSNSQNVAMMLQQSGDVVTGTYDYDEGRMEGTVSGNVLTGTWTQSATSGTIQLQLADDCNSFDGSWCFGSSGGWEGNWVGARVRMPE
jgi:MscS family membrane protein